METSSDTHTGFDALYENRIKVDSIELIDYRKFHDTSVYFHDRLTVLSGKNGSGKSSVLSGVVLILSWIIARLRNENGVGSYVPLQDVNNLAHSGCVKLSLLGGQCVVPNKSRPGFPKEYAFNISCIKDYIAQKRAGLLSESYSLPVFAFYGVKRAVLDMPLRTRSHEYDIFDAYDKSLDGAANFRSFFTWFRACEDWENERRARGEEYAEHPGLSAFRRAMRRIMPDYTDIRIDRHPLGMMLEKNGITLNAEQLSDGEKIYLALIGDLCHRLSLANPFDDPLMGVGIVLVDEIDLHLHPQWQSEITIGLTETFPNLQFIVTTHSPHVINSVPTECLRLLDNDGNVTIPSYGYGMPSEIILEDIMQLDNDLPREVAAVLDRFNDSYQTGCVDEASDSLTLLQQMVPNHPELPRMRKRLERMMR